MRLTGRDPVNGDFNDPLTLNPYLYCFNDPVNLIDPTGELADAAALYTRLYGSAATAAAGGAGHIMNMLRRALTQHYFNTNYTTQAMRIGRSAEAAVTQAFRLAQTQVRQVLENGAIRIFDAISSPTYIEIKNRAIVGLTQQIKDLTALARDGNLVIIVRQGAHITRPLAEWAATYGIQFYHILPTGGH